MKLRNDIQVKAFMKRNKIAFNVFASYLKIDETMIGEATMSMIRPYEFVSSIRYPKRKAVRPIKNKKP